MNDPLLVRRFKRLGDLLCNRQRLVQWDRPLRDPIGKGWSLDQFENQCLDAVGFFQAVDRADVRMIQGGQRFCFTLKSRDPLRIACERLGQDFDCHVAIELGITPAIHFAHAASTYETDDLVRAEVHAR